VQRMAQCHTILQDMYADHHCGIPVTTFHSNK